MKTAQEYLRAAIGYDLNGSHMTYVDALEAVQAAIDDASSVREQVRQALTDYFDTVLPEPAPPVLPVNMPPIRLGERFFQFPPCHRCGSRTHCGCEQPPF
jgi:hypothetical protein